MLLKFFKNYFKNIFKPRPLRIYTDGSHKGKWGAWAYVVVQGGHIIAEASGRERKTNSHRMEFQAAIEALSSLPQNSVATVYTDSKVLLNCMNKTKRPKVNPDQIEVLDRLTTQHKISWKWVRGHSGNAFNERCDHLCINAREAEASEVRRT